MPRERTTGRGLDRRYVSTGVERWANGDIADWKRRKSAAPEYHRRLLAAADVDDQVRAK
jgi:hypothetical protein